MLQANHQKTSGFAVTACADPNQKKELPTMMTPQQFL